MKNSGVTPGIVLGTLEPPPPACGPKNDGAFNDWLMR
jgi:hypothetical protein